MMNQSILLLFSLAIFCLPDHAPIEWLGDQTYDFGVIDKDDPVVCEFSFKNKGDRPLLIDNIRTSCGCTAPDWPLTPTMPDSICVIKVRYDAAKIGEFRKWIKVYFDDIRKPERLYVEGEVLE